MKITIEQCREYVKVTYPDATFDDAAAMQIYAREVMGATHQGNKKIVPNNTSIKSISKTKECPKCQKEMRPFPLCLSCDLHERTGAVTLWICENSKAVYNKINSTELAKKDEKNYASYFALEGKKILPMAEQFCNQSAILDKDHIK